MATVLEPVEEPHVRVKKLVAQGSELGQKFENMAALNIRMICRSSLEIYRQGIVYLEDRDFERSLMLFARFATIGLEHLRKHPSYTNSIPEKAKIMERIPLALKHAENLKKKLTTIYEEDYKNYQQSQKQKQEEEKLLLERKKREEVENQINRARAGKSVTNIEDIVIPPLVETHSIEYPTYVRPSAPELDPTLPPTYPHILPPGQEYSTPPTVPVIDRSTKPQNALQTGNRTVIVPADLPEKFVEIARLNTLRDVETMGILSGKLVHNEFVISHMIIPKQTGGPNSCETDQDDVYVYQDTHDLMSAGWIHTHPSQTAFLSSVDLHTHFPYQLLRPEAIAIVCAPSKNQLGIFMLTDVGLDVIRRCSADGFHPHNQDNLFQECPHARISHSKQCVVADLR